MLYAQPGNRTAENRLHLNARKGLSMNAPNLKEVVRQKYAQAAQRFQSSTGNCCESCAPSPEASCDPVISNLYDATEQNQVPDAAFKASLGCGNPTALAD